MGRKNSKEVFIDTFQQFILEKRAAGVTDKTLTTYVNHFYTFCKYVDEDIPLPDLTTERMQDMIAQIAATGISPNSVRSYTATMSSFFGWCRKKGLSDTKITLFAGRESTPVNYTDEELKRLLEAPNLKSCTIGEHRAWVIVNILVNNGIRASTVRAIQIRDVDLDQPAIILRHTKRRKSQTIPLSRQLIGILQVWMKVRGGEPEDYLFPDFTNNGQMSENCLRNAIIRYNHSRGVDKTSIHAFRHTFARIYLVEMGGSALKLQKLLGHSTLDMTKRYVALYDKDLISDFQKDSPLDHVTHPDPPKKRLRIQ